jgi:hypothetical protein
MGSSRTDPYHFDEVVDPISSAGQNQKVREDRAPAVGNIVAYFKYQSTKHINAIRSAGFQK